MTTHAQGKAADAIKLGRHAPRGPQVKGGRGMKQYPFLLDAASVHDLKAVALAWQCSNAEAVRRALKAAAGEL